MVRLSVCLAILLTSLACLRSHPPDLAARALGELRAIKGALDAYATKCGGYPGDLSRLAAAKQGATTNCEAAGLLPPELLAEQRGGYRWEYSASQPVTSPQTAFARYELKATWTGGPEERRSFWTSSEGEVRSAEGRAAGAGDPALR